MKMANKYSCDRCGKVLTNKEYKKSESSVTGFRDFCKSCLKDWTVFTKIQDEELTSFMNKKQENEDE